MADYYILRSPEHPWGDYGDILMHGMSMHLGRKDGLIQLERTGPFIPPISFPGAGDIVVTDEFRRALEVSGLKGLRFQPIVKRLIVESDWHAWDRGADEPAEFPEGGEPTGYILDQPHSPVVAQQMGNLWELVLSPTAEIRRVKRPGGDQIYLASSTWNGDDLFRANGVLYNYATESAKAWFEQHARDFVTFERAKTTDS